MTSRRTFLAGALALGCAPNLLVGELSGAIKAAGF
jgi:hypothetical protein